MRYADCHPLIVDDASDYRQLISRAFQKAGIPEANLRTAQDGEEAISILEDASVGAGKAAPPSLAVLDLRLPKLSGLDILAWIRESSSAREMPVFLLSSSEEPKHVGRAFDLRADSYFVKPADFAELQGIVEGMLGHWYTRTHRGPASLVGPRRA